MSNLIDKQALQTELLGLTICDGYEKDYINAIYDRIQNAPTINSDDLVKHGEWIIRGGWFRCSECDSKTLLKEDGGSGGFHEFAQVKCNYCPNCGAKMDGGKENE